ncbi:glycerate kinase [Propioniferax innocua]|uniref:Glycerate kinase n=1 Tax=Propioniferax innocua TaxID=1753 RepID=A0A542ZSM4_9ACTN|nr:glycerate kinase [Propioniferax innocua]TQL63354.1 glycerate kinase [Propioniferax innocua]
MLILCAPDSFKESMTAQRAARAMAVGIKSVFPEAEVVELPLADGGEGTVEAVCAAMGGAVQRVVVEDALGRERSGEFAWIPQTKLAVLESAAACGLEHIPREARDPLVTSTRGVGQLISAALDLGAEEIVIGLGGSATNDAGAGMLEALGVRFLGEDGKALPPGGAALTGLVDVDLSGLDPRLAGTRVRAACDVDNPLLGPAGASAVFGPQKGASPADVETLEASLTRWADVMEAVTGKRVRDIAGAGAAGGMAAGLLIGAPAVLQSGADLVLDAVGAQTLLEKADLVLTGEGSFDLQSANGKVPCQLASRAAASGAVTFVFAGRVALGPSDHLPPGVDAVIPIVREPGSLEDALANGEQNLQAAVATACQLIKIGRGEIGADR